MTRKRAARSKSENKQELLRIYGETEDVTLQMVNVQFVSEWYGGVNAPGVSVNPWTPEYRPWEGLIWYKARIEVGKRRSTTQDQNLNLTQTVHQAVSPVTIHPSKGITLFNHLFQQKRELSYEPDLINDSFKQTWDLIASWLYECTTQHKACNDKFSEVMPTRVLEIEDTDTVYLRQTDVPSIIRYATLSHCWGNMQPLRLTKETFEDLKSGIKVNVLPKTFQDAILICQKLNISNLWIDCLCIFQDSKADWQTQSALMSDIYTNAYINIGASSANNSSEGCFFNRDRTHVNLHIFDPKTWLHLGKSWLLLTSAFNDELDQQPLYRRGWVVQERLLAKRMIHFTRDQVWWECREKKWCETFPRGLPNSTAIWELQQNIAPPTQSPKSARLAYNYWMHTIENYSDCQLTFPEDKLVAISGIAKKISPCFADKPGYIAGLWEQFLPEMLLWRPAGDSKVMPSETRSYISPTWSWASHQGKVFFRWKESFEARPPSKLSIEIEATRQQLVSTESPFGAIKHASLRLRAPLLQVDDIKEYHKNYRLRYAAFNSTLDSNTIHRYSLRIRGMGPSYRGKPHIGTDSPTAWQDLIARVKLGSVFALPVITFNNPFPSGPLVEKLEPSNISTGLLVEKVDTPDADDVYRRIGCYDWWNDGLLTFPLRYRSALQTTNWHSITLI